MESEEESVTTLLLTAAYSPRLSQSHHQSARELLSGTNVPACILALDKTLPFGRRAGPLPDRSQPLTSHVDKVVKLVLLNTLRHGHTYVIFCIQWTTDGGVVSPELPQCPWRCYEGTYPSGARGR
jgi:hypothetical protein